MHMQPSIFSPVFRIYKRAMYHISVTKDSGPLQPVSPSSPSRLSRLRLASCPGKHLPELASITHF